MQLKKKRCKSKQILVKPLAFFEIWLLMAKFVCSSHLFNANCLQGGTEGDWNPKWLGKEFVTSSNTFTLHRVPSNLQDIFFSLNVKFKGHIWSIAHLLTFNSPHVTKVHFSLHTTDDKVLPFYDHNLYQLENKAN